MLSFIIALSLVWVVFAEFDYGYRFFYSSIGLDEHIAKYAPMNKRKRHFQDLSGDQHIELFGQISRQVHGAGEFGRIHYPLPSGREVTMLIPAEQIHLQDVRRLFHTLEWVVIGLLPLWILLATVLSRVPSPSAIRVSVSITLVASMMLLPLLIIGPKEVFYWFHEVFFPKHQWFFYWEESLMSCMMKAPYLFGWIAVAMLLPSIVIVWPVYRFGLYLGGQIGKQLNMLPVFSSFHRNNKQDS